MGQNENFMNKLDEMAPDDTAYKCWRCHSCFGKLLYKLCLNLPPPAMGSDFLGKLDLWTCWMAGAGSHKGG